MIANIYLALTAWQTQSLMLSKSFDSFRLYEAWNCHAPYFADLATEAQRIKPLAQGHSQGVFGHPSLNYYVLPLKAETQ